TTEEPEFPSSTHPASMPSPPSRGFWSRRLRKKSVLTGGPDFASVSPLKGALSKLRLGGRLIFLSSQTSSERHHRHPPPARARLPRIRAAKKCTRLDPTSKTPLPSLPITIFGGIYRLNSLFWKILPISSFYGIFWATDRA